jgi:hypothetical protein
MGFNYKELVLGEEFADLLREPSAHVEPAVDLEALGESLIGNLNTQLSLYTNYLEQANRQRLALANRKLAENTDANVESERLIGSLYVLEQERVAITGKILGNAKAASLAKCEVIYPLLSQARAERLRVCRDGLVKATGELKRVLSINLAMVENGSRIVHATVGIMTSVVGRKQNEKMNTYTAKGNVRVGKLQIRNLINRSV